MPRLTLEEILEERSLIHRIEAGGNDGADIFDYEDFIRRIQNKYNATWTELLDEYIKDNPISL